MRTLKFNKESDGAWYIHLPLWFGPKHALMMVAGADKMLDVLSGSTNSCTLKISTKTFKSAQGVIEQSPDTRGYGRDYFANGVYTGKIWLCPVTRFVFFGRYPKSVWFKVVKKETV
jgi:hypothetical protein